jgi:hypothetical protein
MVINFNNWLKRALIIITSLIIVGCSVVTLGYNRLPLLTILELNSIVDLTEEQESLSRIQLDAWLEWHREKHLPQYIVKLEQWEKLIIQDLTPGQFCKEVDVIRTFTNEAVEKFIPALIPIATTLTPMLKLKIGISIRKKKIKSLLKISAKVRRVRLLMRKD